MNLQRRESFFTGHYTGHTSWGTQDCTWNDWKQHEIKSTNWIKGPQFKGRWVRLIVSYLHLGDTWMQVALSLAFLHGSASETYSAKTLEHVFLDLALPLQARGESSFPSLLNWNWRQFRIPKKWRFKKLRQKGPERVMANRLTLVACRIQTAIVVALGPSSTSSWILPLLTPLEIWLVVFQGLYSRCVTKRPYQC